jgi:hypothetical protein
MLIRIIAICTKSVFTLQKHDVLGTEHELQNKISVLEAFNRAFDIQLVVGDTIMYHVIFRDHHWKTVE